MFLTFQRTATALRVIDSLLWHLHYPNLHYHVCDDGSLTTDDGTHRDHVQVLMENLPDGSTFHKMITPHGKFNMGGNANTGIQLAQNAGCDIYLVTQDDVLLMGDLDLKPYVSVLESHEPVGYIRFNLLVPGVSGTVVEYAAPRFGPGYTVPFLRLIREWTLSNPWQVDNYIPAFCPALVHRRFYRVYGYYPEGLPPGETEVGMCNQYNTYSLGELGPQVLWPIPLWPRGIQWGHEGTRTEYYRSLAGSDGKDGRDVWSDNVY
jgi:hypothetical protein